MNLQRILVATDFSPHSEHAVDVALDLARDAGGTVTLLHVCQMPPYSRPELSMYVPAPELTADILASARRALEQEQARYAAKGAKVEIACVVGDPPRDIERYAAQHKFDLIVVGSHGKRGFRRLVLGSVAEYVVRVATMPVLTVHPADQAASAQGAA